MCREEGGSSDLDSISIGHALDNAGRWCLQANADHGLAKELSVLCSIDGWQLGTNQLASILVQGPCLQP